MKRLAILVFTLVAAACMGSPVRSTVGGKSISFSNMTKPPSYTAADYIQDGLIGLWDGIENVELGMHDDAATTWVDLTGNGHDLTVTGSGIWQNDGLYCDGVGIAASREHTSDIAKLNDAVRHYEVVARIYSYPVTPPPNEYFKLITLRKSLTTAKVLVGCGCPSSSIGKRFYLNRVLPITLDSRVHSFSCIAENMNNTSLTAVDGVLYTPIGNNGIGIYGNGLYIGGEGGNMCEGIVFCLRLYDRELTAEERTQNLKVDRVRFGL